MLSAPPVVEDPYAPELFFFFDFDLTLSLQDGLGPEGTTEDLANLFGDEVRRRLLRALLGSLLKERRCYVLTANSGYVSITHILNQLLMSGGDESGSHYFVADDTVRFVHHRDAGGKIKVLQSIVQARGLTLVTLFH